MFEITRYEIRRQIRGTLTMAAGLSAFTALIVGIFRLSGPPGVTSGLHRESPEAFQASFGVQSFGTIEGFLAVEFYQFVWVPCWRCTSPTRRGDAVAGDVESGKLDLVLATPVSRSRLLVERFLALMTPAIVLNLVMPLIVFGSVLAIGESIDPASLVLVHLFSVPYLFVAASVGLLCSVLLSRGDTAQRVAIAVVFMLFVLDSVTAGTNFEWLAALNDAVLRPDRNPRRGLRRRRRRGRAAGGRTGLLGVSRALFLRRDV